MKYIIFLFCLLGLNTTIVAQDYPRPQIEMDKFVEEVFQLQESNVNYEDLYESLYMYYTNPLNLNTATRNELQSLFILTPSQINSFFNYTKKNGRLLSVYELQAIPNFDMATVYKLMPFITVPDVGLSGDNRSLWKRVTTEKNNYLLIRHSRQLETQKGYTAPDTGRDGKLSPRYLGSPDRLFTRFRVSHPNDFSMGFTMEKDPGERTVWDPAKKQYGTDFVSAHFMVENKGHWKKIVVGDYQLQFGQGLVLSSGFAVGKGAEPITTVRRSNLGIRPFTSVLEGMFFRGGAATYNYKRFDITAFYSNKYVGGNIQSQAFDSLNRDDLDVFSSTINITGLHRTQAELDNRASLHEQVYGGNVLYKSANQKLESGVSYTQLLYDVPLIRTPRIYNQFDFNGRRNTNVSAMYNYYWQNFNFFGEAATSSSGGTGVVNGFLASLSPKVDMSMVYRNYTRDFHAFYGNAFGEATRSINEEGIYWGLKIRPISKWQLSAYYDVFRFPWLTFTADAPSKGHEYMFRLTYAPSKTASVFWQYRLENKERNKSNNLTTIDFLIPTVRQNYVVNADYKLARTLSLKSRLQFSSWEQDQKPTYGYAIIQDVNVDLGKVSLSARYAIFDTDDFNNRQYAYEKNVLYAFAIPAYYGRGTRAYLLVNYNLSRKIELWCRVSRTTLRDTKTVGSGLDQINGNTDTEIISQVRFKF